MSRQVLSGKSGLI